MLIIISPAKTLDFETEVPAAERTEIRFPNEAKQLIDYLKPLSHTQLMKLMSISKELAELNVSRIFQWHWPYTDNESRQAIFAFKGDVFTGLDAYSFDSENVGYCQQSLRILSGLYGLLRPLDAIMPYRLEMGTKLKNLKGNDLYAFWGNKLSEQLSKDLKETGHQVLVNLASNEYSKTIDFKKIKAYTITPVFKDYKNGEYKVVSFFAKKARGWMSRFIIENRLTNPDDLKAFDIGGYHFNNSLSSEYELIFTRH